MTESIKFIHISDTHILQRYEGSSLESVVDGCVEEPAMRLIRLLKYAVCRYSDLDFIIITGDLVHEGRKEDYRFLRELLGKCLNPLPVHVVMGNHDNLAAFYEGFLDDQERNQEKPYYYSTNVKGYRLIGLDSCADKSETGGIDAIQLAWLENELKTKNKKGSILLLHNPLSGDDLEKKLPISLNNSGDLKELIEESDVRAVFSGHTHQNSIVSFAGVNSYIVDSTAFGIDVDSESLYFTRHTGFLYCEMSPKNIYTENIIFPCSEVIEQMSLNE